MMGAFLLFVSIPIAFCQSNTNIYGYNYDSNANSSGPLLVQNPNYQFLNDDLANEYAQTYQQETRQYDGYTSSNGGIVSSSSSVPASGYYYGPALTNEQQNKINYQQIVQKNPSSSSSSSSSNIYGYDYSSGSGSSSTNYNNQRLYSAPSSSSTSKPYIYPFGQYSSDTSVNQNQYQVQRDQSSQSSDGTDFVYTGKTYSLFDQSQAATPVYQSASDLKTTSLRDQPQPATLNLRGAGPMPGPTLSNSGNELNNIGNGNQLYRDTSASSSSSSSYSSSINYSAGNANENSNTRFFDVAGNKTVMYYPYRTSTNYNIPQSTSSNDNKILYDTTGTTNYSSSPNSNSAGGCTVDDPYWCQEYVNIFLNSSKTYTNTPLQQSCNTLIYSLSQSYNGCCHAVKAAGCSV